MQRVPKNIDLIVYRYAHRDLTNRLNKEYHNRLWTCDCDNRCNGVCGGGVCRGYIRMSLIMNISDICYLDYSYGFNYRMILDFKDIYQNIYNKFNNPAGKLHTNYI